MNKRWKEITTENCTVQYQGMHQWRCSPEGPCSFRTLKLKGQECDLEENNCAQNGNTSTNKKVSKVLVNEVTKVK